MFFENVYICALFASDFFFWIEHFDSFVLYSRDFCANISTLKNIRALLLEKILDRVAWCVCVPFFRMCQNETERRAFFFHLIAWCERTYCVWSVQLSCFSQFQILPVEWKFQICKTFLKCGFLNCVKNWYYYVFVLKNIILNQYCAWIFVSNEFGLFRSLELLLFVHHTDNTILIIS